MKINHQPEDIATSALELIIKNRGYSDKNTMDMLRKTVIQCMNHGSSIETVTKTICHQLSLLTNISFEEWVGHLYPCDFGEIKSLRTMFQRLQMHTPDNVLAMTSSFNIAVMSPIDSYKLICHIEQETHIDSAPVKWGLMAQFAEKGCVYSMLSLGHLLLPLSPHDPIIGKNKEIANQLFSYAIHELTADENNSEIRQFISKFQNMICEAYLKHGSYLLTTDSRAKEGESLIMWADKHAGAYSRVRRYLKQKRTSSLH